MNPYTGTTKDRVNYAVRLISRNGQTSRKFDACFEMGDGNSVAAEIVSRSKTNERLAANLPKYLGKDTIEKYS
jgi:hypothetical protein